MSKSLVTLFATALLLSSCTAIQNVVGGGTTTTPGGGTGGDPGPGGDLGWTGTPIATFSSNDYQFNLFGCKRFVDDVANVVCAFSGNNTRSYDRNLSIDARGDGYTRVILNDGREFPTLGYKCSDCTKWSQGWYDWKFVSQITYTPLLFKFNIPVGVNKIRYLDMNLYSTNRVPDVNISN